MPTNLIENDKLSGKQNTEIFQSLFSDEPVSPLTVEQLYRYIGKSPSMSLCYCMTECVTFYFHFFFVTPAVMACALRNLLINFFLSYETATMFKMFWNCSAKAMGAPNSPIIRLDLKQGRLPELGNLLPTASL